MSKRSKAKPELEGEVDTSILHFKKLGYPLGGVGDDGVVLSGEGIRL